MAHASALDAFFDWYYRTYPVNATFIGVHEFDHRLPDFSAHGIADALAALDAMRTGFDRLPSETLSSADRLDRVLAEGALDILKWEYRSQHFQSGNPCIYTGEATFGMIALLLRPFAPLEVRVNAAVERMQAIPAFLAQGMANVRRAPAAWTARAIRECTGALILFERGIDIFMREEGLGSAEVRSAAAVAAHAFRDFQSYLSGDLTANASADYACGREALDLLLHRGHFLDMSTDAVEAFGREHFAAAESRLREDAARLGIADWRRGLRALADLHPSAASYYSRFTEVWQDAQALAEAHGLVTWPDYPIRYVPQPAWAREAAPYLYFLSYRAPAAFEAIQIVDYLVTPVEPGMDPEEQTRRLRAANESAIKLNHVIHHGGLGHHLQNWYAYHRAASRIGRIAAVDCASRIALFCGGTMAEGWACYATDLMDSAGFLTPLERLSHSHARLRMAARAIADVRLHTGAWALEEVAAFYRDSVDMPADAAHAEAVKNSMFPGVALAYLFGTELIHKLRLDLQAHRPDFVIRDFHDRFLSYGSVPVALIGKEMRRESVS